MPLFRSIEFSYRICGNFSKCIVKTPKLYFYDSGLLCHLLKITDEKQLQTHSLKASLFENMMIAEYIKQLSHKNVVDDLWFWRGSSGNEVDFLIEIDKNFRMIKSKSSMTAKPKLSPLIKNPQHINRVFPLYFVVKILFILPVYIYI